MFQDNTYSYDAARPYWITKVNLYFLDGTVYPVKLYAPRFTNWLEPQELSNTYLSALIGYWCKYWLKISAYQVFLGTVDPQTGEESYTITYPMQEIPLDKVYMPADVSGEWIDPEEERQQQQTGERLKQMIKHMNEGRHPIDGAEIDSTPGTLESYAN